MNTRNFTTETTSNVTVQTQFTPRKRFVVLSMLLVGFYLLMSAVVFGATIYIDPTYTGSTQNGSQTNPYNSWTKFTINSGNTYLQKSGTNFNTSTGIAINGKSNVILGTYGTGNRAKITSTGSGNHIINISSSASVTVKDLEITSSGNWVSGVAIQGTNASNNQVNNCVIHHTQWGVRVITTSAGNKILKSTINDTGDDGIYIKDASNIEIGFCTVFDVNKKYLVNPDQSYSSGDCIQMASTNNLSFNIHDNILDHSSMGNKFCIIAWGNNYSGTIERNTLIGNASHNTSGIYLSATTKTVIVRYNMIKNAEYGIYAYARTDAYYNAFANNRTGVSLQPSYTFTGRNNVFYNNTLYGVTSGTNTTLSLRNNIFNITGSAKAIKSGSSITSNNNVFNTQQSGFINNYASLSAWRNATGNDMNSVVGNPSFVNASNQDFHLQSGSVAINKGASVSLTKDYYGGTVPVAGAPDAGISEFNSGKSTEIVQGDSIVNGEKEMVVFPNPSVDGKFSIALGKMYEKTDLQVYDMAGRLIKTKTEIQTAQGNLDLSTIPNGAYLIRIDTGGEKKTLKAIKNTL